MGGPLLTTREVAERWRLSSRTILRYAHAGRLPSVRLPGGVVRFKLEDVEQIEAGAILWIAHKMPRRR